MFVLKKNDITSFPFHECVSLDGEELNNWGTMRLLKAFSDWMWPQILAYYGNFSVSKNSEGLYDPKLLLKNNIKTEWDKGVWKAVNRMNRSCMVRKQSDPSSAQYSALVPIILSALKKSKGIAYSAWAKEGIHLTMSTDLYEAVSYTDYPNLSTNELLEIRQTGLLYRSGDKVGTYRNPVSTTTLSGIKDTGLGDCPKYGVNMLTQTWVCHPIVRNEYMILDPKDWDRVPEPLVDIQVIAEEKKKKVAKTEAEDVPWA